MSKAQCLYSQLDSEADMDRRTDGEVDMKVTLVGEYVCVRKDVSILNSQPDCGVCRLHELRL